MEVGKKLYNFPYMRHVLLDPFEAIKLINYKKAQNDFIEEGYRKHMKTHNYS